MLHLFRRFLGLAPKPQVGAKPVQPRVQLADPPKQVTPTPASQHYLEALRESRDRTPIPYYTFTRGWQALVRGLSRDKLIALARYLYDNYGAVSYAVNIIANYSVPLIPQAASPNPAWNKLAMAYWTEWCKAADFTGRFHFDELQRLACKAIDTDGDIGATLTRESGFPQLQFIDGWRIRAPLRLQDPTIVDGVQIDRKGRVVGFHIDAEETQAIPAGQIKLLYDPDRYESYRGVSPLRRGSNDIRDAQDIKAFEKLATKIGAALSAVIEKDGPIEEDVWGDTSGPDGDTVTAEQTQFEKTLSTADLLGGDIHTLEQGEKLHQLTNVRPGDRVIDFLGFLAASFVMGVDIPPAFFLDERLTGPNQRAVNGKAQRKFNQRQTIMGGFLEWAWERVIADAIATKELPSQEGFDLISWLGPPPLSIDEGRDAEQWRQDMASGLMTRQIHFGMRQLDWKRETDQSFEEDRYIIQKARKLAQEEGVPLSTILARYGWANAKEEQPSEEPDQPKKGGAE